MTTKNGVTWYDISEGMHYPIWYVATGKKYDRQYHVFDTKAKALAFIRSSDCPSNEIVHLDCIGNKENITRDSLAIIDHRGKP